MSGPTETSTIYHRHVSKHVSLPERVSIMAGATPERYDFCPICNCVPKGFLGTAPRPVGPWPYAQADAR